MKLTTLIPIRFNDGTDVPAATLEQLLDGLFIEFGAYTVEGTVKGAWMADGKAYYDDCLKVVICCDESKLDVARQLVSAIGKAHGQLAMYLEIDRKVEVEIIPIE